MEIIRTHGSVKTSGSGHHGADYVGVAAMRAGKGVRPITSAPTNVHIG